jgi:hypothetical protein
MSDVFPPPTISPPDPGEPPSTHPVAAAWLAIAGASLLLVASVVVVASRWQLIPQTLRFTGLLTATVLIAALAEQIRRAAPTTAVVIAHLVPGIAITVGIAAGATAAQPWPMCILIGGLLGAAATEVEKRRWASPRMAIIGAIGAILAGCGIAAQAVVPASLLVAGAALVALLCRRRIEATTMALAVGASPLLATLTTVKFGEGTMARIGAAGPVVAWSAPLAGLVAAVVLGIVAQRERSLPWAGAAVASAVLNTLAGLAVGHAPPSLWACLIPVLVIAVELAADSSTGVWRDLSRQASRYVALPFAYATLALAPLAIPVVIVVRALGGEKDLVEWSIPLALAAMATAVVGVTRLRTNPDGADRAIAAAIGCSVISVAAVGASWLAVAGVAVAGLVLAALVRRPTLTTASVVSGAYLAVALCGRTDATSHWSVSTAINLGLTIVGGLLCVAVVLRGPANRLVWPLTVVVADGLLAASVVPDLRLFSAVVAVAAVGSYCIYCRPQLATPIAALTAATSLAQVDDLRWSAVAALLISGAVALICRRSPWLPLAATTQFVAAGWVAVQVAGGTPSSVVGWMIVAAIVLTGIAFTTPRVTGLDTAGVAATALACLSSLAPGVHPALISLMVIVGSAQGFAYGIAQRRTTLATGSAVCGSLALASLWFTTGANATVLSRLARYDFTGADLAALAAGAAMLFVGLGLRRWQGVSSWLAYGPGLALVTSWLTAVQTQRGADWATMCGILIGILAMAIGGWRRLTAPLVIGSALLIATIVIASGSQLASLPGWSWLVLGGIALLGLAAAIERRAKPDGDTPHGLRAALEQFR